MRHLVAAIALSLTLACGLFEPRVHVYVDNGGPADLQVSVDGGPAVTVPPHGYAVLKTKPGSRRFVVRREGQVVHDGSRDFPTTDRVAKYVLNPDRTRRYTSEILGYQTYERGPRFDAGAQQALRETVVRKGDPWVTGGYDEVFDEKPPDSVRVQRGTVTTTRARLCRVAPEDHELVAAAQARQLEAQRSRADKWPPVGADVEAALKRITTACQATP